MKNRAAPSTMLLAALWFLAVAGSVGRSLGPSPGWDFLVGVSSFAFIVALIWSLARKKPTTTDLPDIGVSSAGQPGFWTRTFLILLGLGMTFFFGLMIGTGFSLMFGCGLLGLGVAIAWQKELTKRIVWMGLVAGLICALGIVLLGNRDCSWAAVNLLTVPPAFIGGTLLLRRTRLGCVRLLVGKPGLGLTGFLGACGLAVPAALLNLLGNLQGQDTWVRAWWQPLYAIVPAIAEETWARLFLVSFCYALLWPTTHQRPRRAVVTAILVSLLAHGFGHTGIDPFGIIIGSLLYSLPVALLLIKEDFEHAVGYHFMIDFVRFIAAFLSVRA